MNKIVQAFENKKALICFVTGGDPDLETTKALILAMQGAGADIIEIGIPFSDPVAEGPVIQAASERALRAGFTVDKLFTLLADLQPELSIPLLLMTYINPIFAYGKERFLQHCQDCGVAGIIVPDMPYEEAGELKAECAAYGVALISMIAPTSQERIRMIAKEAQGFLYCVSSLGVTGKRSAFATNIAEMIDAVRLVSDVPCAIGFGISTPEQARDMAAIADGVIIGSAIVDLVARDGRDSAAAVGDFVRSVKFIMHNS